MSVLYKVKRVLFGNKIEIEASNREKIENAKDRIEGALSIFTTVANELDDVNNELNNLIVASEAEVKSLQEEIDMAKDEIQANKALSEKVQQFLR